MEQLSILLKNDLDEIETLSQTVSAFGRRRQLPEDFLYAVNLALEEIVTNVISHGYIDEAEHHIAVRLSVQADEFVVEVTDDAQPFDPLQASPPETTSTLQARAVGGLGIHLARKLMDALEYRREQNKNILIMKKRIGS